MPVPKVKPPAEGTVLPARKASPLKAGGASGGSPELVGLVYIVITKRQIHPEIKAQERSTLTYIIGIVGISGRQTFILEYQVGDPVPGLRGEDSDPGSRQHIAEPMLVVRDTHKPGRGGHGIGPDTDPWTHTAIFLGKHCGGHERRGGVSRREGFVVGAVRPTSWPPIPPRSAERL